MNTTKKFFIAATVGLLVGGWAHFGVTAIAHADGNTSGVPVTIGGAEDTPASWGYAEGNGDFNDMIFSFSANSMVTANSQNGFLSPLTANLVNDSGTIYWDNFSYDGPEENIGYCVLGNGNCPSIGAPFPNIQYLAGTNGSQVNDMTFNASGSVTMTLLAKITSAADSIGWYDPANSSVLNTIFASSSPVGTSVTFTPTPNFGLYLTNGVGNDTFFSQNSLNIGDNTSQHFAMFDSFVTVVPPVIPSADLAITKTVDNATPHVGDTVNYTLTVSALGPATSTGVTATDNLPSGLTFENATASIGTYATSTGAWTIGDLSARSTATLNIAAMVASGTASTTITNTAIVGESASTTDSNPSNNSSSVSIAVQANSPATCTLSASQFEADVQNGSISFGSVTIGTSTSSFTLTNHTSCTAPISLASYKMFVILGGPQWLSTQQFISSASSSVAVGATQMLTVPVASCMTQVDAYYGTAPTNLLDTNPYAYPNVPFVLAWAFSSTPLCTVPVTPTSTPSADLAITKTVDDSTPTAGQTVNYTLTVSALGPATSTGVVATDTLPSGLTFENATSSVGNYASSTGTWTIGDLSASSTATLNIAAMVNAGEAGQTITNTAIVGESASSSDNNLSNNSSSVSITVQPTGCMSNCGGGGTPATSTITVNVTGLNASDTASLMVQDLTASTTQSTSTGNGSSTFVLNTNDNYAVSATTTNSGYSVATSTGCAGTLVANATCNIVFTFASTTPTSTPSTDADIAITKTVDNANPAGGTTVNYTITVTANGPATSTIVAAQDQLPMGLSLVSATTSVGTYDMSTGNWTIGTLSPNATATLIIAATVSSNYDGQTITNTATVTQLSSLVDPNPSNNSSSVSINVQPAPCTSNCGGGGGGGGGIATAQLQITKSVDDANPNPGATINYTVVVSDIGPSPALDVVATDTLPAGVTFVSASSSAGTYDSTTGTWTLGVVSNGTSATLVITAIVNADDAIGQTITNTATSGESSNENNPLSADNTASATITVGGSNGGGGGGGNGGGGGGGSSGGGGGQVLGASASCGIYLDQYIHPVRKYLNDPTEVEKLQVFLNMNLGLNLPIDGNYGPSTIAAVDQFQVKYHIEVLQPWLNYGLPTEFTPTQYVYKTTQRWINLIMCSSLNLPIPQLP